MTQSVVPTSALTLASDATAASIRSNTFLDGAILEGVLPHSIDQVLIDAQYQQAEDGSSYLLLVSDNFVTLIKGTFASTLAVDDNVLAGQITSLHVMKNDGSIPVGGVNVLRNDSDAGKILLPSANELKTTLEPVFSASNIDISVQDFKTALLMNTPGNDIYDPQLGHDELAEAMFGEGAELYVGGTDDGHPLNVKAYGGSDIIVVHDDDQIHTVDGGAGADRLFGSTGADILIGGLGEDRIETRGGVDTVEGGAGDDFLNVLSLTFEAQTPDNVATLIYEDTAGGATIQFDRDAQDGHWTISDRDGETFGTDTIDGMAHVAFTDFEWHAFDAQAVLDTSAEDMNALIEMYIAHFDRAPDALGLHFWAAQLANGVPLEEIAPLFESSQEAKTFGLDVLSEGDFIDEMYLNVLGRASDAAGRTFWEGVLADGSIERADFTLHLLEGAHSDVEAGAAQSQIDQKAADVSYLQAKTDIGAYFSLIGGLNNTEWGAAALDLIDGTEAGTQAAKDYVDARIAEAHAADSGEFVVSILGVIDDPFAVG